MNSPILYVNACVRRESRTARLAEKLLSKLGGPYEEVCLEKTEFSAVDEEYLNRRDRLVAAGDLQNPVFDLARRFSTAETVVIAAPYWDLSFPAALKQYLEHINVPGITFRYSEDGVPVGLCRAERLYYVTTAGGNYVPREYGFGYVKALAQSYYGIRDVRLIAAAGLDIDGADADAILTAAEEALTAEP
ncbi:MAG: NAD(P)H-dependent oxidoreductase [Abditibacteriota bacterium]|nr:NAD(P)H-dependent oxidoreductase [Abditibacteriota bacterium]